MKKVMVTMGMVKKAISTGSKSYLPNINDPCPNKWILELFARLSGTYGRLWAKQHDSKNDLKASMMVWAEQLAGLSREDIRIGVTRLPRDYPPNPMEFRDLCTGKDALHNIASMKPFPRNTEKYNPDKELARKAMANIKSFYL